jgi:3-isopropylmalate dehydrogenase
MMLDWLAHRHADAALADGALAIEVRRAPGLRVGAVRRTREFGGRSGTADIAAAVEERL